MSPPTNQPQLGPGPSLEIRAALAGWDEGADPPAARLAAALERAVADGRLAAGTFLPPERRLGAQLGVGRAAVGAAYRRLEQRGLAVRRQGHGTQIVRPGAPVLDARAAQRATALQSNAFLRELGARPAGAIDLRSGSGAPSEAVLAALDAAMRAVDVRALAVDGGYHPRGLPRLRERIAAHLTRHGQPTAPDEVLVTGGAQQALGVLAACYVPPGDAVLVEDPVYSGIPDAFRGAGARVVGVPVGDEGIDLRALAATLSRTPARAIVVTPAHQSPTGATIPLERRRELVALAERHDVLLVDDGVGADVALDGAPPVPLAALAPPGRVVAVGSTSKLAWGGLRVGWLRAPEPMIAQVAAVKSAGDLGTSLVAQAVAAELLDDAGALLRHRVAELRERRAAVEAALRERLPAWAFRSPEGGVALWVRLPGGGATALAHRAERAGVLVTPGPVVSPSGRFDDHLVLPYDHAPATLRTAVQRLAAL